MGVNAFAGANGEAGAGAGGGADARAFLSDEEDEMERFSATISSPLPSVGGDVGGGESMNSGATALAEDEKLGEGMEVDGVEWDAVGEGKDAVGALYDAGEERLVGDGLGEETLKEI